MKGGGKAKEDTPSEGIFCFVIPRVVIIIFLLIQQALNDFKRDGWRAPLKVSTHSTHNLIALFVSS